jgi:hypothetical protein
LLESEIVQRRNENARAEALERQATELNNRLSEKIAEQQRALQREAELQQQIRRKEVELANSVAAGAGRDAELRTLKNSIEDLRVIQSALCAEVRQLTSQRDAAAKQVQDSDREREAAAREIQVRDQKLAALRHAIFDAARIGTNISRERLQAECQVVDGWKRMITTLLHTPLSAAQRGLVGEIIGALDGWKKGRADATKGTEFQVEPVDLHEAEFNCAEVIESAFAAVKATAEARGAKVQTSTTGTVPRSAHGSAKQIHQLISLFADALPEVGRTENVDVQVSFDGPARMLLAFEFTPTDTSEVVALRLKAIADDSGSAPTSRCGGGELALKSAWQLALAIGASPSIEAGEGKARVRVPVPLSEATGLSEQNFNPVTSGAGIG